MENVREHRDINNQNKNKRSKKLKQEPIIWYHKSFLFQNVLALGMKIERHKYL